MDEDYRYDIYPTSIFVNCTLVPLGVQGVWGLCLQCPSLPSLALLQPPDQEIKQFSNKIKVLVRGDIVTVIRNPAVPPVSNPAPARPLAVLGCREFKTSATLVTSQRAWLSPAIWVFYPCCVSICLFLII